MRMWEWRTKPDEKLRSRCLPTGSTAVTVLPVRRARSRGRASTTAWPSSRRRRAAAVRKMVSPSGIPDHPPRGGAEPGRLQLRGQGGLVDGRTVDPLQLQAAGALRDRGQGLQVAFVDLPP